MRQHRRAAISIDHSACASCCAVHQPVARIVLHPVGEEGQARLALAALVEQMAADMRAMGALRIGRERLFGLAEKVPKKLGDRKLAETNGRRKVVLLDSRRGRKRRS